jgi:hypothetical protein
LPDILNYESISILSKEETTDSIKVKKEKEMGLLRLSHYYGRKK